MSVAIEPATFQLRHLPIYTILSHLCRDDVSLNESVPLARCLYGDGAECA